MVSRLQNPGRPGRWAGAAFLAGFVLLQLTNPPRTNPPPLPGHDLLASNAPPPDIAAALKAACYNCHSCETRWPWYSRVAPVSWWVAGHVKDAREVMNFSDWPHDQPSRVRKRWDRIAEAVEAREMPLPSYLWMHPESRLNGPQRARLVAWARQTADSGAR
jgi:hypothetical protein